MVSYFRASFSPTPRTSSPQRAVLLLQFFFVCASKVLWRLFYHYLFLISTSFGAAEGVRGGGGGGGGWGVPVLRDCGIYWISLHILFRMQWKNSVSEELTSSLNIAENPQCAHPVNLEGNWYFFMGGNSVKCCKRKLLLNMLPNQKVKYTIYNSCHLDRLSVKRIELAMCPLGANSSLYRSGLACSKENRIVSFWGNDEWLRKCFKVHVLLPFNL